MSCLVLGDGRTQARQDEDCPKDVVPKGLERTVKI